MEQQPSADGPVRPFSVHAIHTLRTAQTVTMSLSQMADQKASMLMGASFVVFSLAVGRGLTAELPVSLAILALFAFLSATCAAVAVMPSVGKSAPQARPNLLFFGHFAQMDEQEWTDELLDRLHTDETVFLTMMHDLYQNGCVLQARKYRYLGYAYRLFLIGLAVTLISFATEVLAGWR